MRTATVRDLRNNFAQLAAWLKLGEEIEITSRGKPMGRLVPALQPFNPPDIMARLKEWYGDEVLPEGELDAMLDEVRKEREF